MPRSDVDLIVEDVGHERFVRALVQRVAEEVGVGVRITVLNAHGGRGKATSELVALQHALAAEKRTGDMLVVVIDANCKGASAVRSEILGSIRDDLFRVPVVGCPDPHVERWYLADLVGLKRSLGVSAKLPKEKCGKAVYKTLLREALQDAGHVVTLGGAEFADEIVAVMDLYKAGKSDPSLRRFIDDLRGALKSLIATD
jgi:hypothetical protein